MTSHRKVILALILAGCLLAGFVAFLIASTLSSQQALQTMRLEQFKEDAEKRAFMVSYYLSNLRQGVMSLEKKMEALGLWESLAAGAFARDRGGRHAVAAALDHFLDFYRLRGERLFRRITILGADGTVLLDRQSDQVAEETACDWRAHLDLSHTSTRLFSLEHGGDRHLALCQPAVISGKTVGHLMVWIAYDTLTHQFLRATLGQPGMVAGVVNDKGEPFAGRGQGTEQVLLRALAGSVMLSLGRPRLLVKPTVAGEPGVEMVALRLPIADSAFFLVTATPSAQLFQTGHSPTVLAGAGLLFLLLLAGASAAVWGQARHVALRSRLQEVEHQRRTVESRNRQLEEEMNQLQNAEEALMVHEARYANLVEQANSLILRLNRQGEITFLNTCAQGFFGFPREEIVGRALLGTLVPLDAPGQDGGLGLLEVCRQGGFCAGLESLHCRADGSRVWISWSCQAVLDETGQARETLCLGQDISARRQAEEKLKEALNTLQTLIEASPLPIMSLERDGLITMWNPAAARVFGWQAHEVLGRGNPMVPPERQAEFQELRERVFRGESHAGVELQRLRKDGVVIDVSLSAAPMRNAQGEIVGAMAVLEDITQRRQAARALEESEERFKLIFEYAPDAFFLHDPEGRFIEGNRAAAEILGYSREELRGKNFLTLPILAAQQIQQASEMLARNREGGNLGPVEFPVVKKNGERLVVEVRSYPVNIQGQDLVLAIARDITRRREAEAAAAEGRNRQAAILSNIPDIAWLKDKEGRYIAANEPLARSCGLSPEALAGKTDTEIWPADLARRYQEFDAAVLKSGRQARVEEPLLDAQGQLRWIETIRTPIFNDRQEIIGTTGIARDITERKQAEETLKSTQERVHQTQKMEALGTLAGGIAHDFNNLLTPMIGYIELILSELSIQSALRHDLEQVLVAGFHARELVQQILTFSRKTPSEPRTVAVGEIIQEGVKLLRSSLPATIEIVADLQAPGAAVVADPSQLHQVLMNLGTNAFQAMRERGGTLTVRLEARDKAPGTAGLHSGLKPGPYVVLTVSDTGPGIPPQVLGRIFEPYFTTKQAGEGSGLGLAIVHGIVKEAGGDILVQNESGRGATFQVFWPQAEVTSPGVTNAPPELPIGSEHILLVDDEVSVMNVTQRMLRRLGYRVTGTTSSAEAIQLLIEQPQGFDLIFSDLTMPQMTGDQLSQEIRRLRPDVPIILCTGFSDGCDEDRIRELGIQALIMKPLMIRPLAQTVRQVLDHRAA